MAKKKTVKIIGKDTKTTVRINSSTENMLVEWVFDNVDKSGKFAFNIHRADFDHKIILERLLSYSTMKWSDVKRQTHDDRKSKHHYLDYERMSSEAKERITAKKFEEDVDSIYSFALNNIIRVIGIRDGCKFHVVWYDPKHEFYPSKKKHT